ncbi:MAG: hypothetical protein HY738_22720 [Bacteroidia bacterium]|nr:hypothetical protein [Bacteroidia bacterium]
MILEIYKKLRRIAEYEFNDIIADSEIIFSYTGRARKLRLYLIDNTFIDIWYSLDGKYSLHWERENFIKVYRHDNAPHNRWKKIKTFPKHCHDGIQDNVIESHLSNIPEHVLKEFLIIVRKKLN